MLSTVLELSFNASLYCCFKTFQAATGFNLEEIFPFLSKTYPGSDPTVRIQDPICQNVPVFECCSKCVFWGWFEIIYTTMLD